MLEEKIHPYIHDIVGYTESDGRKTLFLVTAVRIEQPNETHPDDCVLEIWDRTRNLWIPESDLEVIIHPIDVASRPVRKYLRNENGKWEEL